MSAEPRYLDPLAERLARLQRGEPVRSSELPAGLRSRLQSLFDARVLTEPLYGRGRRVHVADPEALARWIRDHYPEGLHAPAGVLTRADAVRLRRSAKAAGASEVSGVLLRGFNGAVLAGPAGTLDVAALTRLAGCVGLAITDDCRWQFRGTLVTVENEDAFFAVERLLPAAELVVYTAGKASERLVRWVGQQAAGCRVVHWGDYDPVGLEEYLRIKAACAGQAELFLPSNLEGLFRTRDSRRLLAKRRNQDALQRVLTAGDPEVSAVAALIARYGCGLEQEALL